MNERQIGIKDEVTISSAENNVEVNGFVHLILLTKNKTKQTNKQTNPKPA